ncbi:uncharacterized protein LOC144440833 [Glandiceps talaboti]
MVRRYQFLVLLYSCFYVHVKGVAVGSHRDENSDIRFIHENTAVGYEVYRIPGSSPIQGTHFKDGNQHGRFHVNGTDGSVTVAGLMDFNVQSEYVLNIGVTQLGRKEQSFILTVQLINSPDWPPIYNETCAMSHRQFGALFRLSQFLYPLDITFNANFAGSPSVSGMPLYLVISEDKFAMDIDNDKCKVQFYWPNHRRGLYLLASLNPDQIDLVECRTQMNSVTSLPKWKIYPNPRISRPDSELIPDSWFESTHKPNDKILNEGTIAQYSSSQTTQWQCNAAGVTSELLSFYINIRPAGCPYGKYGGKCHKKCICQNGATCHPFNGACRCSAGWKGPDCTIPNPEVSIFPGDVTTNIDMYIRLTCTAYHYQVKTIEWYTRRSDDELVKLRYESTTSVVLEFTRAAEHHSGVYECHMKDIHNKVITKTVKVEVKDCQEDLYGKNCDKKCDCKNGASCDRNIGCVCPYGLYGSQCQHNCRCSNNVTCRTDDGMCICRPGSWGIQCQNDCLCGAGSTVCEQESGKCQCDDDWGGDRCEKKLSASAVDPVQNPIAFVSLVAGLTFAVTIIISVIACAVLHHKEKRKLDKIFVRCRENRRIVLQQWHPPGEEEVNLLENQDVSSEEDDIFHAVSHDAPDDMAE